MQKQTDWIIYGKHFLKRQIKPRQINFFTQDIKIQCKTIFWEDKLKSDKLNWDTNVENMGIIAIFLSTKFLIRQVIRRQINSGQIESGQIESRQIEMRQIKSRQIKSRQIESGQIESGQIKSGQIVSGHGQNLTWSNLA